MEIAGYSLGRLLGQGTFGRTYAATKNGELFAMKVLREDAVQAGFDLKRFQREIRALQKAEGPHVVRLLDAGVEEDGKATHYYVVLEYLEGDDLARAFSSARDVFDEGRIKSVLTQIVHGLRSVHAQNVVHRDLKPANVFLTVDGTVKLLDFGLVKMLDYTALTTVPGREIGTPLFIAPEILRGEEVDGRADFYSFGVLAYYLVTGGHFPFVAQTPLELYVKVITEPPVQPVKHNRSISREFENLVLSLLSKHPYERSFDHDELVAAIEATPVFVPRNPAAVAPPDPKTYPKTCLFRPLHNEKAVLENYLGAGGEIDGVVFPANFLPKYRRTLDLLRDHEVPYLLDPVSYRLAYSSFSQTEGLVNLPYVPNRDAILTAEALQSLQAQQAYARACIDWQAQWGCSTFVAPFHFCRELASHWVDVDVKLLEEAGAYARSLDGDRLIYAGMCLPIEPYTDPQRRLALLNRYSRAKADGYFFYVDHVDEQTSNPLQLLALVELLRLFQRLGKPVFACRVGTLGLGLLSAGADGIENGIASLSSFSEANLLANRSKGYDMTPKYYIPGLLLSFPVPLAEEILSDPANASLRCQCRFCAGRSRNLAAISKAHFLQVRSAEVRGIDTLGDTSSRLESFVNRVRSALRECEAIRRQGKVPLKPGHYSHLKTWEQVFSRIGESPNGGSKLT